MSESITIAGEINRLLDRRPFQSFTLVMTSGDRYEVTDEHQMAVGEFVLVLLRPQSTSVTMRTIEVAAMEVLEPA